MKEFAHDTKLKNLLKILLGVASVGWLTALWLLWHRQTLISGELLKPSFCHISSFLDCDAVALSSHSSFFGFASAAWGMFFYSIMLLLGLRATFEVMDNKHENVRGLLHLLLPLAMAGVLVDAQRAFVSLFVIKALCVVCAFSYLINFVMLVLAWQLFKTLAAESKGFAAEFKGALKIMPTFMWVLLAASAGLHGLAPSVVENMVNDGQAGVDANLVNLAVNQNLSEAPKTISTDGLPAWGAAADKAVVTIVEYSDLQCPFCARSNATLHPLVHEYQDKVRVVFKNYPLDPSCNTNMKGGGHAFACLAAKTGWCVFKNKGNEAFFTYKDSIFHNQAEISSKLIEETALASGITAEALKACVDDTATHQSIVDQIAEGSANGVQATPSVFFNGKPVSIGPNPKVLQALLEHYVTK